MGLVDEKILTSMSQIVTEKLWNGSGNFDIRFANYIDGDDGPYLNVKHSNGEFKGMNSFMYPGWNLLGRHDKKVQSLMANLLNYLRNNPGGNDSGTHQRNATIFGRLNLAAGLLYCDRFRRWQ